MEFHRQLIHQHHLQSHLHCGNDPTVANHNGILSTANARNTGETPFTMRNRSETPPMIRIRTHETVSHPSHRRGRSRRSGTDFVWKNTGFRASAISQKRISCDGNLILELQITMEFHRQLIHQHHLQSHFIDVRGRTLYGKTQGFVHLLSLKNAFRARLPSKLHRQLIHQHHLQSHLHCGNDPTVANHNGILSTANARNTGETPFTMRNRSETDPPMIRP